MSGSLDEADLLSGVRVSSCIPLNTENLFNVSTFTDDSFLSETSGVSDFCWAALEAWVLLLDSLHLHNSVFFPQITKLIFKVFTLF